MNITGFSNARSSEYMVLYDLYNRIKQECKFFYPFYYHRRRDDTNLSRLNKLENLKVVACFARRPKTDFVLSSNLIITFRNSIFDQVNLFNKFDIPVLAASPMGTGIEEIGFGSKCQWFKINPGIEKDYVEYEFREGQIKKDKLIDGIRMFENDDIHTLLKSVPNQSWIGILEKIEQWDITYSNYYFTYHKKNLFNSVSGLKPIFIALKTD